MLKRGSIQKNYAGSIWSLLCAVLCLALVGVRLWVQYAHHYTFAPGTINILISLFLLFCAYRFLRQYFCYIRFNNEQLILAGIFRDKKIILPDIEQMSFHKNNHNIIYLLLDSGKEYKINLLDINPKRRDDFKKAFYIRKA